MKTKQAQFPFVEALYRKEANPDYKGNPFIEALPALPDDQTLARALTYLPKFDPFERDADRAYRVQRQRIMKSVMVALPRVVRLARAMLKMTVDGYSARKPNSVKDNAVVRDLYRMQQAGQFVSVRDVADAPQDSMALIGAAGCGKTFSLKNIAGMFPPVIHHKKLGKWQLPFLFVEMSYDGESVHTLASAIFKALDDHLPDAGFSENFARGRNNAEQRLAKALAIAHELGVGQIIIDESQNRRTIGNEARRSSARKRAVTEREESNLTKLLITASNTSHIPLLFAGTLEMHDMSLSRFSKARRMAGRGSAVWKPLTRYAEGDEGVGDFELLLRALWKYQFVNNPVEFNDRWADLFFDCTQGVPDLMVKMLESSLEAAIASGAETLTPELVLNVVEKEFSMTATGVRALKTNERFLLDCVPDLHRPDSEDIAESRRAPESQSPVPRAKRAKRTEPHPLCLSGPEPMEFNIADILAADMRKEAPARESQQVKRT